MSIKNKRPASGGDSVTNLIESLSRRAEAALSQRAGPSPEAFTALSPEAAQRVLHDLQVHQIELEMQNEELRRTHAALETSRARYLDFYELTPAGFCTLDEVGLILNANLSTAELLGVAREDLPKRALTNFILPDDQDIFYRLRQRSMATLGPQDCALRLVKRDDAQVWVHLQVIAVTDEAGARHLRVVLSNITEHKRVTQELFDANIELAYQSEEKGKRAAELAIANIELAYQSEEKGKRAAELAIANVELAYQSEEKAKRAAELLDLSKAKANQNLRHHINELIEARTSKARVEAQLRSSEQRYRTLTEWSPEPLAVHDGRILLYLNPAAVKMFGAESEKELLGKAILDLIHPDCRDTVRELIKAGVATGATPLEERFLTLDGTPIDVEVQARQIDFGGMAATQVSMHDITERKAAEGAQRVAAIAFETQQAMFITDAQKVILRVNKAYTEVTGYTAEESVGQTPSLLKSGRQDPAFYTAMWECISRTGTWQGEIWNRRKNGTVYAEHLSVSAVKNDAGTLTHYVGSFSDLTSYKAAEEQIHDLAFTDLLTGLPNRRHLIVRLQQAITAGESQQYQSALLILNLDNFKNLNSTLGRAQCDQILQHVAKRLNAAVRDGDTVARVDGDQFAVILTDLNQDPQQMLRHVEAAAGKMLEAINQPYQLAGSTILCTASVGITLFGAQYEETVEPLKRAELALYQAKAAGRNTLRFFDADMQAVVDARIALEAALRQAINNKYFVLYYQAQVSDSEGIVGVEALIRWIDPKRGMVSPVEFIPLAEETGLILPIGAWVLETACQQLALWAAQPAMEHLSIAVNVSAQQFRESNFVEQVLATLERTGGNPRRLKLELTESVLIADAEDVIVKMNALKAIGIGFAIDDFGTGYSSLSYLKRLPLERLKIDQSFVRNILMDPDDAAISRAVIAMATSMGLGVIAEGVETEAQSDFLASLGCHNYQGYLFSKPLPVAEFEALARGFDEH